MKLTAIHKVKKAISNQEITLTFVRFYTVGLLLFILPFSRSFFITVISWSLLFVIGIVLYKHRHRDIKTILFFLFIMVASFLLEMTGTNTGKIFGSYYYDRGLGIQLNHTPLIIGLNWVFLVYASHDLTEQITRRPLLRILLGALFMVMYDIVMEWVAPVMKMWHFESGYPPIENFISWFVAALVFHSILEMLHIRTDNFAARRLFIIQIVFFLLIGLFSLLLKP